MIEAYKSHINLTTIPLVLFYYNKEDNNIVDDVTAAKGYFVQSCSTRDYIETMFLIELLEDNGLVYLDRNKNTTKGEYIEMLNDSQDTNERVLIHKLLAMPEKFAITLARHYYSNIYINSGLIDLFNRNFKTIEEEELEQTRTGLKRSKGANIALWMTLIVTILFQGADTLYNYLFNKKIPTNISISSIKTTDDGQTYNCSQDVVADIKCDTTNFR